MTKDQFLAELAKGLPAAFVALIIGLIAAYIAFHQYRVARDKLRLDLFERRYELYDVIWTFLSEFENSHGAARQPVTNEIPKAHFLFGAEIAEFFAEVLEMHVEYRSALGRTKTHEAGSEQHSSATEKVEELLMWSADELAGLRTRFRPYLGFQKWQH